MNLAAILGICLLSPALSSGSLTPTGQSLDRLPKSFFAFAAQNGAQPQAQAQSQESTPTSATPASPVQTKPSPQPPRHHKKAIPKCSNSPTALNPPADHPAESANSTGAGSIDAGSTSAGAASTGSAELPPCPPPKKVVRNGGSDEPTIQLTGGTTAEQALHERSSTDQLTAATEANLKKAAGLRLNPSQQEMVSQIKQFMEQSKTAVAAGDLERGRNLAMKAHLLSDELVKP